MIDYKNLDGHSGVKAFEFAPHSITIQFNSSATKYTYEEANVGAAALADMKALALAGVGLNTYINQHVRHHNP